MVAIEVRTQANLVIQLPSLQIERSDHREIEVFSKIKERLELENLVRPRGVHVSDLLDPRLSYWQETSPKEITERTAWFFAIGKVLHMLVVGLYDVTGTDSGTKEELGILYSPDLVIDNRPIELKTSRAQKEPPATRLQSELSHYLEQLCCYLVLSNSLSGELWILYISLKDVTNRTFPEIRCYNVALTEEQFFEIEKQIVEAKRGLLEAKTTGEPSKLPLCRAWKCGDVCPHWIQCRPPGRYGLQRKNWAA